jgi:formylglycine-generating enzyme required for sulfatase activity
LKTATRERLVEQRRADEKAEAERRAAIVEEQRRADEKAEAERRAAIVKEQRRAEENAEAERQAVIVEEQRRVAAPKVELPKTRTFDLGNGVNLEMLLIPVGTFMMGSPESEAERRNNETQHQVTISKPYYLGIYPITQAQWQQVMGNNPSHFKGDKLLPVENVSWDDTQAFCLKLKEITQTSFCIPTEAQWEYACRAGTTTPFHFGSELNGSQANCNGNKPYPKIEGWFGIKNKGPYLGKISPVGKYSANAWGLYDMHGNVWEWCTDWYGDYPTGSVTDPIGPATGSDRVFRGGSWGSVAVRCRSANRDWFVPSYRDFILGFRVALSTSGIPK